MTDEYGLIFDYDMVVSLGKIWFQIDRYVVLMFGTYWWHVCLVTGKRDCHNKVIILVYGYIYLCDENYVFMILWCRGLHGKDISMTL